MIFTILNTSYAISFILFTCSVLAVYKTKLYVCSVFFQAYRACKWVTINGVTPRD